LLLLNGSSTDAAPPGACTTREATVARTNQQPTTRHGISCSEKFSYQVSTLTPKHTTNNFLKTAGEVLFPSSMKSFQGSRNAINNRGR